MIDTTADISIRNSFIVHYYSSLIDKCFKILPMRENNEPSLCEYIKRLQHELLGHRGLFKYAKDDGTFISLLSVLQYLRDNSTGSECNIKDFRREVFNAISMCETLRRHLNGGESS